MCNCSTSTFIFYLDLSSEDKCPCTRYLLPLSYSNVDVFDSTNCNVNGVRKLDLHRCALSIISHHRSEKSSMGLVKVMIQ